MDFRVQTNLRKTCRTCLRVHGSRKELISIFEVDKTSSTKSLKYSEMLTNVTDLTVAENDEFPKGLCIICLQQIRGAFFFKTQANNSFQELQKHLMPSALIPIETIKKEVTTAERLRSDIGKLPELTLIVASRSLSNARDDRLSEDMLVEIEPPKLQEKVPSIVDCEEDEESDDQEMIDYEPIFSEGEHPDIELHVDDIHLSNEKSPDSGINEDATKSIEFNERQLAECETGELKEFECNVCGKQMISWKALLRHKRNFHERCKFCRKKCGTGYLLKIHVKTDHPEKYNEFLLNGQTAAVMIEPLITFPSCDTCEAKFFNKEALLIHHADCDKKCIECGLKIPQRNFYFSHLETEHNIHLKEKSNLECPFGCSDNFSSETILMEHVLKIHPEDKDEASTIDDSISEESESRSNDTFSFKCQHCEARFSKQRSLTTHIGIMHKSQDVVVAKTHNSTKYNKEEFVEKFMVTKTNDLKRCIPCKKDIHRKSLNSHLKGKHASQKSYLCELCPEAFFRSDYRLRHMTYSHINDFRCKDCNVQFDRAYKYDAHMVKHGIPAKNFKSEERFDKYDLLMENMKYIEDSSTYDYSKKPMQRRMSVFPSSSSVEVPMTREEFTEKYLTTVSEKQSYCTICQQKIMKSSIITHLIWKHALLKPMKCAFCNDRVVKNRVRLTHMNKCHPNEYRCFQCDKQFAKHALYADHMLEVHQKKIKSKPSSGEENDLLLGDIRFITQPNEEEIIEEPEDISIELENPPSYDCKICVKTFSTDRNLKIHNSHKHKDQKEISGQVSETSSDDASMTFEEFRRNHSEDVSDNAIECLICKKTTKKRNFVNHVKSRHATFGAFKCPVCPETFFRPEHRIQHLSKSHRGMFFCQTCNIQFHRNSRYARHMKDSHEIEVDSRDKYEVDLDCSDLRFLPYVTKTQDDESSLPSIVHDQDDQEDLETSSAETNVEEFTRDQFIVKFIKVINKETRRCIACDKTMLRGSIYNHLMIYHAKTHLFKCPFCDVRLERAPTRIKHLQMFHPDEYKCHDCGIQFQKHSQFCDHMMEEHNFVVTTPKAPGEEKDISSVDIKYVLKRPSEESNDLDESSVSTEGTSTSRRSRRFSTFVPSTNDKFLKPKIKEEPKCDEYLMHSIFGRDPTLVFENEPNSKTEFTYNDFKLHYVVDHDVQHNKCLPCNKTILKTSVSAHLRMHHAIVACYNCELCDKGFQRADYRIRHMKFSHPDDYNCTYCNIQFHRSTLFREHMVNYHKMTCNVTELKTKEEVDVHLESMKFVTHLPEDLKMASCPIRKQGRPRNEDEKPFNPDGGGVTFREFKNLHMETVGDDLKCKICDTLSSNYTIKRHLRRCHATSQSYFCEVCNEGFHKIDNRMKHMEKAHPDHFKCVHCKVQFYYSQDYVEHMQVTHKVKVELPATKKKSDIDISMGRLRFLPEQLGVDDYEPGLRSFRTSRKTFNDIPDDIELTREQFYGKFYRSIKPSEKGSQTRMTKCLACLKVFSSKNRYFHSLHNHATRRQWICEICNKGFFLSNKRSLHMRIKHPNHFHCTSCATWFDRGKNYVSHMLEKHNKVETVPEVNDDEINVPGDIMRFTKKSTAFSTLKKEQDEVSTSMDFYSQPYPKKCEVCYRIFDSTRELRMHQRNHSSLDSKDCGTSFEKEVTPTPETVIEKPKLEPTFECEICGKMLLTRVARMAHQNFKHKNEVGYVKKKRKGEKVKFDVDCDICSFTSHRRDYIETHVKASHKTEFDCPYCYRKLSNYNIYMFHVREAHRCSENVQRKHVCEECGKGFRKEESLKLHKESKHNEDYKIPDRYCKSCGVSYHSEFDFAAHNINHYHLQLAKFVERLNNGFDFEAENLMSIKVKSEPEDIEPLVQLTTSDNADTDVELEDKDEDDPFSLMMKRKLNDDEPPKKRFKPSQSMDQSNSQSNGEDKLDYLSYLQCVDDGFKCGICGKTKSVRKHMLHHLKQHEEIPTYRCSQCNEKFVFKRKYEKHLEMHSNQEPQRLEMSVDEHPKYQEVPQVEYESNVIKCQICDVTYKLKIMLNRHNSTWHSEENSDRMLSMHDQKLKKEESKQELVVIKLLKCKLCLEAFIKPDELNEHLKTKHDSKITGLPENVEDSDEEDDETDSPAIDASGSFACGCKLTFKEKKFLESHQKNFCINRQTDQVINEQ